MTHITGGTKHFFVVVKCKLSYGGSLYVASMTHVLIAWMIKTVAIFMTRQLRGRRHIKAYDNVP